MKLRVKWFFDRLKRNPAMGKLPSILKHFRRRGKYGSVRRSQVFRHRFHSFFKYFGKRMYKPSFILGFRSRLAKRAFSYLRAAFFRRNVFRMSKKLRKLSFRLYIGKLSRKQRLSKRRLKKIMKKRINSERRGIKRLRRHLRLFA